LVRNVTMYGLGFLLLGQYLMHDRDEKGGTVGALDQVRSAFRG